MAFLPGRFSLPALLLTLAALAPIAASRRPTVRTGLLVAAVAGLLDATAAPPGPSVFPGSQDAGWVAAHRLAVAHRLDELYGPRAPLVSALTLARREGLDPEIREAFARSGTAHLLAISGFHVGVIAGMAFALLRAAALRGRAAGMGAALVAWLYVALLGFPDAASRAAVILTGVAASRLRGRPAARWGGLGTALLFLVALDPARLLAPGFQLSFAGAAGLTAWAGPLRRKLGRLPDAVAGPVAAGVAATAATLPVVAWHFERISLVGIPATLVATPLVVVALPGALLSVMAHALHPEAGRFLAGGVGLVLEGWIQATEALAGPEWASVWLPRTWVAVAAAGVVVAGLVSRSLTGAARRRVALAGAVAGIVAWPGLLALQARGTTEVVMVDVGQGDAVAVRTPAGRWLLVDAGPPWRGDPGAAPVVRALRRRGVRRLEALVLTHPDLDHFGGAPAVLASFDVGVVVDPAWPVGKPEYLALLEEAGRRGVAWRAGRAGEVWAWDGVELAVLHPDVRVADTLPPEADANDLSLVLALRWGAFDVLLPGDAPRWVEERVLGQVPAEVEVLKVGHHGSATSTSAGLVAHARPRLALVPVGARNRFGHPHPDVVRRLLDAGAEVHRTDLEGTLRVLGRRDGSFAVHGEGRGRR